ncbi:MAG: ComEA family DNA-binding protein [Thermoanaerobaculia bacterium]
MNPRNLGFSLLLLCFALPAPAASGAKKSSPKAGAAGSTQAPAAASGTVNLNSASAEQIALLPRVGIKVARRIVDYRKGNGDFKRVEDVMEVKGVGEKLFTSLREHLSIAGATTLTTKVKSTGIRKARPKTSKAV